MDSFYCKILHPEHKLEFSIYGTSDGNAQRSRGVVAFSIPDQLGRVAMEGEALASSQLQRNIASMRPYALRNQTLSGCIAGYGVSVLLQNVVVDKAYYYDDYSYLSEDIFSPLNDRLLSEPLAVKRSNNLGLLTGILTRVTRSKDFDGSITPGMNNALFNLSAFGYDSHERVAQSVTLDYNGVTLNEKTEFSTNSLPLSTTSVRTDGDGNISTVSQQFGYDNLNRQVSVRTAVDGEELALMSTCYSGNGRVESVEFGDVRKDYRNKVSYIYLTNGATRAISASQSQFGLELLYGEGANPMYSGNISAMEWSGSDGVKRSYSYIYDSLNRLVSAAYNENDRASRNLITQLATPDYSTSYSYDIQGNVSSIDRKGLSAVIGSANEGISVNYDIVDKLTLIYSGNRLKNVRDEAPAVYYTGATDFDDAEDDEVEYGYDSNGNLTVDLNRGIVGIVYNSLNRPLRIEFADGKSIENIYDADGNLLQRCLVNAKMAVGDVLRPVNVSGELAGTIGQRLATTTDYSGPWQYVNGTLDRIHIPGGYIKENNVYFYIPDHQGNIRQVWNATTNLTVQDNHYYPYGSLFGESASTEYLNVMSLLSNSSHSNGESGGLEDTELNGEKYDTGVACNPNSFHNLNITISSPSVLLSEISDNAYRYGGKEWISFRGLNAYDFTARLYDPALGRFHNPDPLNSSYSHLSPYLYCTANPINATDPSGLKWDLSHLSDDDRKRFEGFFRPQALGEEVEELCLIYDFIENSDKIIKVKFENISTTSVEGLSKSVPIQLKLDKEDGGTLFIANDTPVNLTNFSEDIFHCYQHVTENLNSLKYNVEFEAKLFAQIVGRRVGYGIYLNDPLYYDCISYLNIEWDVNSYNETFFEKVNNTQFNSIFNIGVDQFVNYNNENNIGNKAYRDSSKSRPKCLIKFYNQFKIPLMNISN